MGERSTREDWRGRLGHQSDVPRQAPRLCRESDAGLVGYLASFGAFSEEYSLEDMLPQLEEFVKQRERDTGISLAERIIVKRRKMGLP